MSGPLPAFGYLSSPSRLTSDMQTASELVNGVIKEMLGAAPEAATLSITSNSITPPNYACVLPVDQSGGGTINTVQITNSRDGQIYQIHSVSSSNPITLANMASGSGVQIATFSGQNIVLTNPAMFISLKYNAALNLFQEVFPYANWAVPGAIGSITPNSGTFTTIALTGAVSAHTWLGNATNSSAEPSFQSLTSADLPATSVNTVGNLSPIFSAAISAQALNFTLTNAASASWFGNASGSSAPPSFNTSTVPLSLIPTIPLSNTSGTLPFSDITGTVPLSQGGTGITVTGTADQIIGVNHASGTSLEYKTLTAGSGIIITPAAGTITIAATGGGGFTNPMTTLGDAIYGASGGTATRLAGNTTANKKFLSQTGTGSASAAPAWNSILPADVPIVTCGGRCYLVSGSPWADGSSTGNATIYFGPANSIMGNLITIGSTLQTFAQTSLALTATASTAYYIYVTSASSTTVAMGLLAWTNQTTPPTTYTQNGQLYADSAFTKLIVGGFNCRVANTVFNWTGERALSNYFNQIQVPLLAQDSTVSWTTTSSTSVAANGSTVNGVGQVQVFNCVQREPIRVSNFSSGYNSATSDGCNISIALNGTTVAASQVTASDWRAAMECSYCVAELGLSTWARQNLAAGGGTATYYGATNGFMEGTCFA